MKTAYWKVRMPEERKRKKEKVDANVKQKHRSSDCRGNQIHKENGLKGMKKGGPEIELSKTQVDERGPERPILKVHICYPPALSF